jgi:hypothetical protein
VLNTLLKHCRIRKSERKKERRKDRKNIETSEKRSTVIAAIERLRMWGDCV